MYWRLKSWQVQMSQTVLSLAVVVLITAHAYGGVRWRPVGGVHGCSRRVRRLIHAVHHGVHGGGAVPLVLGRRFRHRPVGDATDSVNGHTTLGGVVVNTRQPAEYILEAHAKPEGKAVTENPFYCCNGNTKLYCDDKLSLLASTPLASPVMHVLHFAVYTLFANIVADTVYVGRK